MTPVWWLLGFIPALLLLYFLKLKRQDIPVSSTMLWRKSLEDLHVNSPFQRLRRSLLFLLQLLILLLLITAIWRPRYESAAEEGRSLLVFIDVSASMNAREADGSRLDLARREALKLVDSMESADRMMLLSFGARPVTVQPFTSDAALLRTRIGSINSTSLPTDFAKALSTAHSLAQPLGSPEIYFIGDGGHGDLSALSSEIKVLKFQYLVPASSLENVGITEAEVRRTFGNEPRTEIFALVRNNSKERVEVPASLYRESRLVGARVLEIEADGEETLLFDVTEQPPGMYRLEIEAQDALTDDDRAYVEVIAPRNVSVLLAGRSNPWLEKALQSIAGAEVERVSSDDFAPEAFRERLSGKAPPVVVFDRWLPEQIPTVPAIFVGCFPPWPARENGDGPLPAERPVILDWNRAHPINRFIVYADIYIEESRVFPPGPAYRSLVETEKGSIIGVLQRPAPEGGTVPAVCVGFDLLESNWPLGHFSFPIFFSNAVTWLGTSFADTRSRWRTGEALVHRVRGEGNDEAPGRIEFVTPSGERRPAVLESAGEAVLGEARQIGVYEISSDGEPLRRFGVSLLNEQESRLEPQESIDFGEFTVAAQGGLEDRQRDLWTWFALAALVILILEWFVYNRRVYV